MSETAIIQFADGSSATYDGEQWTSADHIRAARLNDQYSLADLDEGVLMPYHPNPVAEVATWAAEQLGAVVIQVPDTDSEPGVIY